MSTSSGTRASRASTTAGRRFAAAVPEVQVTATGAPVARAMPSATKPAERSSITDTHSIPRLLGQHERQRRVARAGAGDRVAHAAASELVDERLDRRVGAVDRHARVAHGCLAVTSILLVPGFMQRGDAWEPLLEAAARERYTRDRSTTPATSFEGRLAEIAAAGEGAVLCGYSLGGRLALHAALRDPGRYAGVVTIGASAGIEEPVAAQRPRRGRRAARRLDGDACRSRRS